MASWRTHNKRARRRRERDAQFMRNLDKLVMDALNVTTQDSFKRAIDEFAKGLQQLAQAMIIAVTETNRQMAGAWGPLDPKYARIRCQYAESWPNVVYEDVLDAEYIDDVDGG
jgi:hypothetical protein